MLRARQERESTHKSEGDVADKGCFGNELQPKADGANDGFDLDPERDRDVEPVVCERGGEGG